MCCTRPAYQKAWAALLATKNRFSNDIVIRTYLARLTETKIKLPDAMDASFIVQIAETRFTKTETGAGGDGGKNTPLVSLHFWGAPRKM